MLIMQQDLWYRYGAAFGTGAIRFCAFIFFVDDIWISDSGNWIFRQDF